MLTGMERSWLQGYTPEISHDRLTLVLPIISPVAEGAIHGEVLLDDERLSPFPLQDMTATARGQQMAFGPCAFPWTCTMTGGTATIPPPCASRARTLRGIRYRPIFPMCSTSATASPTRKPYAWSSRRYRLLFAWGRTVASPPP